MVEGTNFNKKGDDLVALAEKKLKGMHPLNLTT